MIGIVTAEIERLEYTAWQCRIANPHGLDIEYMEDAARILRAYRDLHPEYKQLPAFEPPEEGDS